MTRLIREIDRYSLLLLATVLLATLLPASGQFAVALGWVTKLAIAMLFFLHGAKLSRQAILSGITNWKLHIVVFLATFMLFPLLGVAFSEGTAFFLDPMLVTGILFLTLLPSTVQSSIAFTSIAGGNVPAAVCAASLSNFAGIFITPVLTALLIGAHGSGGDSLAAIQAIMIQLLLPFLAGHLLRPLVGGIISRHKYVVSLLDRGSILLVVYSAFSAAVIEGLWQSVPVWQLLVTVAVCILLLALVLAITHYSGRALGFSPADRATILFCGSKKSLASGVPMAGVLFPAAQVGAIILPLMIFHQLQLLVCAAIAQRWARKPDVAGPAAMAN
ncbi:bile acid:sodium symporter [Croceicoccus estronivorus]|uniref:bile acid:sodium symporter family protein n=1 Tax=Croceicoccus estronivorus TaxID=1172626 RepID=UPI000832C1A6|nr:bile acid:sodium symporter family protein [Croceicoccus estronivorus]OCC25541.1 bile acid:sodium symporter [Croceicoccus estronivorus]